MTVVVLSPHLDDAVFSCGEYIAHTAKADRVVVVTVCSRVFAWQQEARTAENDRAVRSLGAYPANLGLPDDPVGSKTRDDFAYALDAVLQAEQPSLIVGPLGLKHPDHLFVADNWYGLGYNHATYEDLPYRVEFPEKAVEKVRMLGQDFHRQQIAPTGYLVEKRFACMLYETQWREEFERCCFVPERIWRLT